MSRPPMAASAAFYEATGWSTDAPPLAASTASVAHAVGLEAPGWSADSHLSTTSASGVGWLGAWDILKLVRATW